MANNNNVRCVVHIGPDKTGSTAIQQFCHANRAILENLGICYSSGREHVWVGSSVVEDPTTYDPDEHYSNAGLKAIEARNKAAIASLRSAVRSRRFHTVILSHEALYELNSVEVSRLADLVGKLCDERLVVFYCRDPQAYASSGISQRACSGRITDLARDALDVPVHLHGERLPAFLEFFGRANVVARPFDRNVFRHGQVVHDFFETIGHPIDEWPAAPETPPRVDNPGRSWEAALIAIEIAKHYEASGEPMPMREFNVRYRPTVSKIRGRPVGLTDEQRVYVRDKAREHTEYIEREFSIRVPSEPERQVPQDGTLDADTISSIADILRDLLDDNPLIAEARRDLDAVHNSLSWRITAPLRGANKFVRSFLKPTR